jgi:hypothetical protein
MTDRNRHRCILLGLTAIAIGVFFTGIGWGLPSRRADAYLFGKSKPWTGAEILRLAGDRPHDKSRGADVALHPIEDRRLIVVLNDSDQKRAEIVRRYRMYSYQPDEMVTFMSLSSMKPSTGDFDPKLYQYGGLFIYPAGAALKVGSKLGLIELKSDTAYYVDHPEAFARFYLTVRGMVAIWGVVGVWAVYAVTRRLTGGLMLPALAGVGFIVMPVVVNMSHEAKPHLPGAVLMLLTVIAAERYVRSGAMRWAAVTGALAGAALGMVLSSLLVFIVLPLMVALRGRDGWAQRLRVMFTAGTIGIFVYFLTNPYVAINLVRNRAVLRSNLGNSTAMYSTSGWTSTVPNAAKLLAEGASPGIALIGVMSLVILAIHSCMTGRLTARVLTDEGRQTLADKLPAEQPDASSSAKHGSTLILLLAAPALAQGAQFFALAAGKPGEYGRFALFLDVSLLIAAVTAIGYFVRHHVWAAALLAVLVVSSGVFGLSYLGGFIRDTRPTTSRLAAADQILHMTTGKDRSIAIWVEPAPYALPPVNLFTNRLLLLPRGTRLTQQNAPADLLILPADAPAPPVDAPANVLSDATFPVKGLAKRIISWADRSFCILPAHVP